VEWHVQMASAFLVALPTLLVYIFLSRYFIRGLMADAFIWEEFSEVLANGFLLGTCS
jgi:hypothetical protein